MAGHGRLAALRGLVARLCHSPGRRSGGRGAQRQPRGPRGREHRSPPRQAARRRGRRVTAPRYPGAPAPLGTAVVALPPRRKPGIVWLLAAPVFAILLWTVVYPNANVVAGSFEGGLGHWREFLNNRASLEATWWTLVISLASVLAATAIGIPLAFLLTRVEFPGRRLLSVVATLPAALPPLVGVVAFLFLFGESGVLSRVVQHLLGLDAPPWSFTGVWAIVVVHGYTMYVYVFLFVSAGLERFDTSLDEAAAGLGASGMRRLFRVTLPMLTPAIAGSMLLVFMSSLGSFSAPYVFGGGVRVLSTQILASKLNGNMPLAYVETTMLALSAVAGLALFRWLERRRAYTVSAKGAATRIVVRSVIGRTLGAAAAVVLVKALVLPHLMVTLVSF